MYAPDIDGNLLSVKKLLDNGYTVNFVRGACEISYKDRKKEDRDCGRTFKFISIT